MSGRNNLLFFAGVRGIRRDDAVPIVDALEQELELGAILAKRVDRCSTGMVQQLAFARALPVKMVKAPAVPARWILTLVIKAMSAG